MMAYAKRSMAAPGNKTPGTFADRLRDGAI
jgi:hypothetical protein